jgi:hypothetical protein
VVDFHRKKLSGLTDLLFRFFHDGPHAASGSEEIRSRPAHTRQERLSFLFDKRDAHQIDN